MKKKYWLAAALAAAASACFIAGCTSATAPEKPDESLFGGTSNDETDELVTDKFITVDGRLDEECWENQKRFDFTYEGVRVQMTTAFGKLGFYVGYEVKDSHVFSCVTRPVWMGSSIEFYADREDATIKSNRSFQFRMDTLHESETLCGYRTAEGDWTATSLPIFGRTQVQGTVNSGMTEGLTAEIFVRWDALGYDYTAEDFAVPQAVKIMPVYNQSSGAELSSQRDFWVNNGGDIGNPMHYWLFDEHGYTGADAENAVIGDSAYGRAKTVGWDISKEAEGEVKSTVAGDQSIFFKNFYETDYAVTALVTFERALKFWNNGVFGDDPYPKAGLILASDDTIEAFLVDYDLNHRVGSAEGMFFKKGNPDPRATWQLYDYKPLTGINANATIRLTGVKLGKYLLVFAGGGDTERFGGTFIGMQEIADVEGNATPGFYSLGCQTVFSDYAVTTDREIITNKTENILSVLTLDQKAGGALSAKAYGYTVGSKAEVGVTTYEGYSLTSLKVNGEEMIDSLSSEGVLLVDMNEKTVTVTPTFVREESAKTVAGTLRYIVKNAPSTDVTIGVVGETAEGGRVLFKTIPFAPEDNVAPFDMTLPAGEYSLSVYVDGILRASREVSVEGEDVNLSEIEVPLNWVFEGSVTTKSDGSIIVPWNNQFRAVKNVRGTEFFVSTSLERTDGNFDVSGTWETGGIGIKVDGVVYRVYVMREGASDVVVYLGVDGGDSQEYRQGGTYTGTGAPVSLDLAFVDGEIHLLIDGKTHYVLNESNTTSASLRRVFTSPSDREFGFITIGKEMVFSGYDFGTGVNAANGALERMKAHVTLPAETANLRITADKTSAFFGERVTLNIGLAPSYFLEYFKLNGVDKLDEIEDGTITFVLTQDVTVTASAYEMVTYAVTGTFGYKDGLFTEGSTVTVASGALRGTVSNGAWSIALPDGTHTVNLVSSRFQTVSAQVTVSGGEVSVAETLTFSKYKFEESSGYAYDGDDVVLNGGNMSFVHFAGVEGKDGFVLNTTLSRTDNATDVSGTWQTGGFIIRKNGGDYKFWIMSGDGKAMLYAYPIDNNWDNKLEINLPCEYRGTGAPLQLSVIYTGEELHLLFNGSYLYTLSESKVNASKRGVYAPLFTKGANDTVSFGLLKVEPPQGVNIRFADLSYALGEQAAQAALAAAKRTVTEDRSEGVRVHADNMNPAVGSWVRITWTIEEGYTFLGISVNGQDKTDEIKGTGDEQYLDLLVTEDVTVKVTAVQVSQTYTVSGSYGYASGLFAAGDSVSVKSGAVSGTASDGAWSISLPDGDYTVTLVSARFKDVTCSVTVEGGNVTVNETLQFTAIKFVETEGFAYTDDGITVNGGAWTVVRFAGVEGKDGFAVETTLERTDRGQNVAGTWQTGGIAITKSEVDYMLYFMKGDDSHVVVYFLIKNIWDPSKFELAGIPYVYAGTGEEASVKVIYTGDALYLAIGGETVVAFDGDGYKGALENTHNLYKRLFNGDGGSVTFGLLKADSPAGIAFSGYNYQTGAAAAQTALDSLKHTVTVGESEHVTLTPSAEKVFVGSKVTVTVAADDSYALDYVKVNGRDVTAQISSGSFEITVTEDLEITASAHYVERSYTVSGTVGAAEGQYFTGDTVALSGGGVQGTVNGSSWSISLPDGSHTLTFTSTRFETVTLAVTVDGDDVAVSEQVKFTKIKFTEDSHGSYDNDVWVNTNAYWQASSSFFAGIDGANGIRVDTRLYRRDGNFTENSTWNTGGFVLEREGVQFYLFVKIENGGAVSNFGDNRDWAWRNNQPGVCIRNITGTGAPMDLSLAFVNNTATLLIDNQVTYSFDVSNTLLATGTGAVRVGFVTTTDATQMCFTNFSYSAVTELPEDFKNVDPPTATIFENNTATAVYEDGSIGFVGGGAKWIKGENGTTFLTSSGTGDILINYTLQRIDGKFDQEGTWNTPMLRFYINNDAQYDFFAMRENATTTVLYLRDLSGGVKEFRVPYAYQGTGAPITLSVAYSSEDHLLHVFLGGAHYAIGVNDAANTSYNLLYAENEKILGFYADAYGGVISDLSYSIVKDDVNATIAEWGAAQNINA